MDPEAIGARLRRKRLDRGWDTPDMARALRRAGHTSDLDDVKRQVHRWEATGKIAERNRILYASAFKVDVRDLFEAPDQAHDHPGGAGEGAGEDQERLAFAAARPGRVDGAVVDALSRLLATQRRTEDVVGSSLMIAPVHGQLTTVEQLAREAGGAARRPLIDVAAQWAQFAGWLNIAVGDLASARAWLDRAAEWALEVGDATMLATILSFKGELAYQRGDTGPMISLAQAAQRDPGTHVAQLAFDAQFEARGHAMRGDVDAARRMLDEALPRAEQIAPDELPPWMYYKTPTFLRLDRGLVYRYLGEHEPRFNEDAITALTAGIDALGEDRHAEWGGDHVLQLAIAYAQADAPDCAVNAATEAAVTARATASRRLVEAVAGVHRRLAEHWPDEPGVAELGETLR